MRRRYMNNNLLIISSGRIGFLREEALNARHFVLSFEFNNDVCSIQIERYCMTISSFFITHVDHVHLHTSDAIFENVIESDEMFCWIIIDCDGLVTSRFYGYIFSFGLLFCNIKRNILTYLPSRSNLTLYISTFIKLNLFHKYILLELTRIAFYVIMTKNRMNHLS